MIVDFKNTTPQSYLLSPTLSRPNLISIRPLYYTNKQYTNLLNEILPAIPSAPDAHLIFWFPYHLFEKTKYALLKANWQVQTIPFIWYKTHRDISNPFPGTSPLLAMETAFLCSRRNRTLTKSLPNIFTHPCTIPGQMPIPVYSHFLSMLVDPNTTLLDLHAHVGHSLMAADNLGAATGIGLIENKDAYRIAQENWRVHSNGLGITI